MAFHGVMMENIPSEYKDYVHYSQLHPYIQHLEINRDCAKWVITCLNDQAKAYIIDRGLDSLTEFDIKRQNNHVRNVEKKETTISEQELTHQFYNEQASNIVNIKFLTPTAFKQAGRYLFLPVFLFLIQFDGIRLLPFVTVFIIKARVFKLVCVMQAFMKWFFMMDLYTQKIPELH